MLPLCCPTPSHTHNHKEILWGLSKMGHLQPGGWEGEEGSHQAATILAPWSQTSIHCNFKKINIHYLSHPVRVICLWQPGQTNIHSSAIWQAFIEPDGCECHFDLLTSFQKKTGSQLSEGHLSKLFQSMFSLILRERAFSFLPPSRRQTLQRYVWVSSNPQVPLLRTGNNGDWCLGSESSPKRLILYRKTEIED